MGEYGLFLPVHSSIISISRFLFEHVALCGDILIAILCSLLCLCQRPTVDSGAYNRRLCSPTALHQVHGLHPEHFRPALLWGHFNQQVLGSNSCSLWCGVRWRVDLFPSVSLFLYVSVGKVAFSLLLLELQHYATCMEVPVPDMEKAVKLEKSEVSNHAKWH